MKSKIKLKECLLKDEIVWGILLAIGIIAYNFIWLNRSFTMSEGWAKFYTELMADGKVPYKDFYYYLPPLNLLIDALIWKLSGNYFIIYRLWRLLERIVIAELMYGLVRKKLSNQIAVLVTFLGVVLASANVYDLIGDYNQTVQFLVVLLCYCLFNYVQKNKYIWIAMAGGIGACMFLCKQTVVVACFIFFAVLFCYLAIIGKEKNFLKFIIVLVSGAVVPLAVAGGYLLHTNSLSEFIEQVFVDTGSKGSLLHIIIGTQMNMYSVHKLQVCAILLILIAKWIKTYGISEKYKIVVRICQVTAMILFIICYSSIITNELLQWINSGFLFVFLLLCLLFVVFKDKCAIYNMIPFLGAYILLILNPWHMTETIYPSVVFDNIAEFITVIYIYFICSFIYGLLEGAIKRNISLENMIWIAGGGQQRMLQPWLQEKQSVVQFQHLY